MTAVIYARYSSDNQREESIEGQIRECTAYAEKNGITVVKHYIDRAISAKTDNRPQFQQMIKDSERKLFDIVLVWKLDRFARNRYDSARYKTQLKKNGVKLMSATEIISDGPEGIILESVLEGYAEYYSADLSEKVVRGMTENALKGKYNGGAVPIGYVIDAKQRFQPDFLTAPFVAEAFKRYNEGATMTEIRDWLNKHHVKNPRGGSMTYNTVQHMLNNRRYIGELKYRDILIADAIPPLVSAELFQEVQEKMAKNKKAPARRKAEDDYLLTTKLFCGHCGALMFGESGTSRTGDVHRYYKCAAAKKRKTCTKKTVRKQWLEDLVVNETMRLIQDDTVIDSLVAAVMELQNRESTSLPLYEKQLRETETGIQNMLNAIQAGILTSSTKERLEVLEAQKKDLEAKIAEEKLAKPVMKEEFVRFWLLHFRKLDLSQKEQRQTLIDTFINAIYLYDDKVLITFNYKEGTETISFGEATEAAAKEKSSDMDCLGAPFKQIRAFLTRKARIFACSGGKGKAVFHPRQSCFKKDQSCRAFWPGGSGLLVCLQRRPFSGRPGERRALQGVQIVGGVVGLGAVAAFGCGVGQHPHQLAELLGVGAVVVLVGLAVYRPPGPDGGQLAVVLPLIVHDPAIDRLVGHRKRVHLRHEGGPAGGAVEGAPVLLSHQLGHKGVDLAGIQLHILVVAHVGVAAAVQFDPHSLIAPCACRAAEAGPEIQRRPGAAYAVIVSQAAGGCNVPGTAGV
ncbi:recombinase family protein [Faecalibacterium sp. An58]|uniref:recombinase family protein n=1 Tax=Faecalibacterium sp. An58 TaxID=1965648 RepID=UPI001FA848A4|nr:recombinase family protein [Faecalibacterium sp. An58]